MHWIRRQRRWPWLLVAVLLTWLSLSTGPAGSDPLLLWHYLTARHSDGLTPAALALEQIRLPRLLLAILVGGALAVSGAVLQGLCRNPLADPGLLGLSSGAALAALASITLHLDWGLSPLWRLPLAAFVGALITGFVVIRFAYRGSELSITHLILAGVGVNALTGALMGLLSHIADESSLKLMTYWTLGSVAGASWPQLIIASPLMLLALALLWPWRLGLTLWLLGERDATTLGVDVRKMQRRLLLMVSVLVAVATAFTGVIGFVGLVVPHLCRMLLGTDNRVLLPASLVGGAMLMVLSDWLARTLVAPQELPVGIVTALIGTPVFLYLLRRQHA
ncbi:FecCD family ABC transporter permease [Gallaecimonas mangrovi]|uniref:FecCD family ABC transporter permease n=1 Tax=Gallaecimonas mangrovi TaxID=2291597 RepID=UPI000E205B8C|nr:iron ABC transporter permease [Gallaecimonas mangrovi]